VRKRENIVVLSARWANKAVLVLFVTSSARGAFDAPPGPAQVVVTATRTAETADDTLASVTVITRADIERLQPTSLADLVTGVAGVEVVNNGGPGKATSFFLRGSNSDHVLVLVDGVKVGSATLGTTAFEFIPVDAIDRIEIVRGPRSSLYGSEAIGGVIQIFTRRGGGATTPYFSVGAGSYETATASAGIAGGGDNGWFNASAGALRTRGFNACRGSLTAGCFTIEPDADGYRNLSGSLRGGYRFDNGVEVDAHVLNAQGKTDYDGSFQNQTTFNQLVVGGSVRFSPIAPWRVTLSGGQSQDNEENLLNGVFSSRFDTTRNTASFQNDVTLGREQLATLGVDYQSDAVDSDTAFTVTSRYDTGVFGEYQGTFGIASVKVAGRYDDNSQFGSAPTGSAALGLSVTPDLRVTASYGTAFKAPTFNELYFPGFGNPNLEPEKSRSAELGISAKYGWGTWAVNIYRTQIQDLIALNANFTPINIGSALIRGIEWVSSAQVLGWRVGVNLTLLDPRNESAGPDQGKLLPRRAQVSGRVDVDRSFGKLQLGATVSGQGHSYDDLDNTVPIGGFATVDLRAAYALSKDWSLQARVGNLFDKSYETAAFFNQPGLNVFVSVRYQPTHP
jgi:vitamin B12 transporter